MRLVVVGSGPSGVHFAETALERGHEVVMLDVGRERPAAVAPDVPFDRIAETLADPVRYLLGERFEGVILPSAGKEYYGLPPSKGYVLDEPAGVAADGFHPLFSFARGGLAEAWTGGVYPFNDEELREFPIRAADLAPCYDEVARRIGISGEADDLARFWPLHEHLLPPLRLDAHSAHLAARYRARAGALNAAGVWLGRSRIATLTEERDGRRPCAYLGRCLWGCPHDALYTPSVTLTKLLPHSRFRYVPDAPVTHFTYDADRRITGVAVQGGGRPEVPEARAPDGVVLAAGALASARIYLESRWRGAGERVTLTGLMDNQQVLVPFITLGMLGSAPNAEPAYQYHQVCVGLAGKDPAHYVHGQITTLKTAMVHPVIQSLPLDLRSATAVFRLLRSALGIANVNLHDTRRETCTASFEPGAEGGGASGTLRLRYAGPPDDAEQIATAVRRMKAALRRLGCLVPPGMTHVRPKGASVHYAGLLPMGRSGAPLTATADCRSTDFANLWLADGITFPFLPAKNVTFTLMANAVRVARTL